MANKPCLDCGRPIQPHRVDALYCSAACRQRSYRGRLAAQAAEAQRPLEAAKRASAQAKQRSDFVATLIG
jgi:hypothetical protein